MKKDLMFAEPHKNVKPAVCCCVYLNTREKITPVSGPIGSNWSNWLKAGVIE